MNKNQFHRRSIRLQEYDYSSAGGYFVTIVTWQRENLFGELINDAMHLNHYGQIVKEEWFNTAKLRPGVELIEDEFVIMPNHIHGIVWLNSDDMRDIGRGKGRGTARCAPTIPFTISSKPNRQFGQMDQNSIPVIVRAFKSAVTRRINNLRQTPGKSVWQRNYYEHIIASEHDYGKISDYIKFNPLNWNCDKEYMAE